MYVKVKNPKIQEIFWLARLHRKSNIPPIGRMGVYTRDDSLWEEMLPIWTSDNG